MPFPHIGHLLEEELIAFLDLLWKCFYLWVDCILGEVLQRRQLLDQDIVTFLCQPNLRITCSNNSSHLFNHLTDFVQLLLTLILYIHYLVATLSLQWGNSWFNLLSKVDDLSLFSLKLLLKGRFQLFLQIRCELVWSLQWLSHIYLVMHVFVFKV